MSDRGHPMPRRSTPEKSLTLQNHHFTRRNSSGESQETGNADAKKWFENSNRNPTASFGNNAMEGKQPRPKKQTSLKLMR